MPISVEFQQPPGTVVPVRQFEPGSALRVAGKVTTTFGLPNSLMPVRLELYDAFSPLLLESRTNAVGNYWFDITLPGMATRATVAVSAWFPVGGWERAVVPIGIGAEPAPMPVPQPGLLESLFPLLILGLVMALLTSVRKVLPGGRG